MAKDTSFHDHVMDKIFRGEEGITSRRMFDGWGIYQDDVFFALISGGRLYFKVDESNKDNYEKAGSEQFSYEAKGKRMQLSYWELPVEVMEDPGKIGKWVEKSVQAAKQAKKKK